MSTTTGSKKTQQQDDHQGFSKLQQWVFPIYNHELIKIVPLIVMMLSALFVYTVYRDIKDSIVFNEERQSMITVQWCKVFVMIVALPVATLFMKLANVVSRDFIFYQTVFFFAAFFMLNAFLLYPNKDVLHSKSKDWIRHIDESYDVWANALMPIAGVLLFPINTAHYLASELWGTVSVSFLLWGYVNQITPKEAAKRYYGVLGLGAQLGPISAGYVVGWITHGQQGQKAFLESLTILNMWSFLFMVLFAAGYAFMQEHVMKLPRFAVKTSGKKKSKPKMSIVDSIKYCVSNPYVLALGGLVFAYGWCMVVGELSYKDVMKLTLAGDPNAYSLMKGYESFYSAALAMVLMLFVSHNIIRICGWKITALLAPAVCSITVGIFYFSVLFYQIYEEDPLLGPGKFQAVMPQARTGMWLGIFFCIASKGTKYASFDPAKELAYLPLSSEEKYKSKAAVDIVGARFGKGGAALFNIFVLNWLLGKEVTFETTTQWTSFTAVVVVMGVWVASTLYLAGAIKRKEHEKQMQQQMEKQIQVRVQKDGDTITHV
eukprot:75380_1